MKTFVIILAVLSLLLFSGEGYFIWSQHNQIQELQIKVVVLSNQQTKTLSEINSVKLVQKRINHNESVLISNQEKIATALNGIIDRLSSPEQPSKLDKAE